NEAIAGLEIKPNFRKEVLDKYLFFFFSSNLAKSLLTRSNNVFGSSLNKPFIENIKIPFPKLEVQERIISESEKMQRGELENNNNINKLRTEIRQIINSLKGKNDVRIGNICTTSSGGTPLTSRKEYYQDGTINWLTSGEVRNGLIKETKYKITELGLKNSSAKIFPKNTVLVAMYGATAGQVGILGIGSSTNQAICGIIPNEKTNPKYLYYYLRQQTSDFLDIRTGVARPNLSQDKIKNFKIPVLSLSVQDKIVKEIEQIESKINKLEEVMKELQESQLY
ncbi:MAG: restriction endonuclease subunit S, partial [Candidatus Paceibacterota bacterium]